jgi:pimeloyl-ACP methyl ester carboxylesterase
VIFERPAGYGESHLGRGPGRLHTWLVLLAVLAAAALAGSTPAPTLKLEPCDVQTVAARCGTLRVPENRARPNGRTIGLHVVVVPARHKAAPDAFTYLAGGPGAAATEQTYSIVSIWAPVNEDHDILLVDQRGTGESNPVDCPQPKKPLSTPAQERAYTRSCLAGIHADPRQYGTRAAMDDLDAVRAALGYEQLDVYGTSYGATAAQVYLKRHRHSVRTLILDGATAIDVPFYGRFARNAQHALVRLERRCAAEAACARAFPHWPQTLTRLIRAWNARPVHRLRSVTITGDELAGVVQTMLLSADSAASIPLVVARAAAGDYGPLNQQVEPGTFTTQLMFWSIWCNEPWVGLGAKGPWHTDFDGYTAQTIAGYRRACSYLPRRAEPAGAWTLPRRSLVPLLVLAGGADPQDPVSNFPGLRRTFPNARAIVVPDYGHAIGQYGCLGALVSDFVDRASAKGLDTHCVRAIEPPPFALR